MVDLKKKVVRVAKKLYGNCTTIISQTLTLSTVPSRAGTRRHTTIMARTKLTHTCFLFAPTRVTNMKL
jgi:hypothetical protein